jgi:hypothetical protein
LWGDCAKRKIAASEFRPAMESGMKTITSFVFVVVAAACAGCATNEPATSFAAPRTLAALPQPQIYSAAQLNALRKTPGGNYPGYQHIVADGQNLYCRKNRTTDSNTETTVICLTEAQIWTEQLRAQVSALERAQQLASAQEQDLRRSGTQQLESQEAALQQLQNVAVNYPVTPPMGHP